jgi:hypothetical protein
LLKVEQVQKPVVKAATPPPPVTTVGSVPQVVKESKYSKLQATEAKTNHLFLLDVRPVSLPVQPIVNEPKRPVESNSNKIIPPPTVTAAKSFSTMNTVAKPVSPNEQNTDNNFTDNLTTMITEQRRQNRLLEQVIAAVNTTNALLTQLVQR